MLHTTLRIALIGLGHVAKHQLAVLATDPRWKVVGAADIDESKARTLPPYIRYFRDVPQLLADVDIDVCLVATGPAEHFEIGKQVLASGRHLILEKPCCTSLNQLAKLIELAKEQQCHLIPALHARHALDLQWFLAQRDSLQLGNLLSFECRFFDPYVVNGQLVCGHSLGGSWIDSGINALSVIASIIPSDDLSLVTARFSDTHVSGCEDFHALASFMIKGHAQPAHGTIETHWGLGLDSKSTRLRFGQIGAEVVLDHSRERVTISRAGTLERIIDLSNGRARLVNHYVGVFDAAYRELSNFGSSRSSLEFGLSIHKLLFAAQDLREASR